MRPSSPPRDLPPRLELLCLKALWSIREGNVRDVQRAMSASRTLAYTTVLTVLDRLARRGAISRRKEGRAFVYWPQASRDSMRRMALRELVDIYFDGSETELVEFLRREPEAPAPQPVAAEPGQRLETILL